MCSQLCDTEGQRNLVKQGCLYCSANDQEVENRCVIRIPGSAFATPINTKMTNGL